MFITLCHVWPLFYHFISILTLFGTLAHLSPQLFTLISPTILLVVYYFYHLFPLSQSFANLKYFVLLCFFLFIQYISSAFPYAIALIGFAHYKLQVMFTITLQLQTL